VHLPAIPFPIAASLVTSSQQEGTPYTKIAVKDFSSASLFLCSSVLRFS
jgi:hypothetical protein